MKNDVSRCINLNHVVNARQLGGLKTKDGRTIKKDCLIRSGQLYMADEADVGKLKALNIKTIVDFRGSRERNQKPDAFVGEDNNFHLPVIREHNLAIERNDSAIDFSSSKGKTGDFMMDMSLEDPEAGKNFMNRCYRAFIEDAYQVSVYSQFIHRIIETKDGAVLWHCAGGKDRAGFGSIVILAILGVSKEDILEDYLMTNFYNHEDISRMREKAENAQLPADIKREDFVRTMLQFCDANEKYFDQIFMAADELYGGFDQYIRDGLHISAQHIEELRDRYLI